MDSTPHHAKKRHAPQTELWQVGIVHAPIAELLDPARLTQAPIHWLPEQKSFAFIADPFGIHHADGFTVFAEALDYRIKRGEIHYFHYDSLWKLVDQGVALRKPYHLSYPFLIEDGGEIYMLPEAHRSGRLTLYRASQFPKRWEPVATLLEQPAIDASVIRFEDRWWMFYTLPGSNGRALRELHIAYADALTGPWLPHTNNPVRDTRDSGRPGGTPFIDRGTLYLPMQDCTVHYGDAITLLRVDTLTQDHFSATAVTRLDAAGLHPDYADGLHTLSAAQNLTLIDVKRFDSSRARRWINLERRLRRLIGQR